jgi:acyl-coenzyme A thioesterase PaaI-like protein
VNIVRFGPSTEGWPSIVHGGLLATVLDETLGRVAIRSVPAHTGVTAHLDVQYQYLMLTERFYKIIATLDRERSTDRKSYVTAYIYDREGKLYCKGEALFVVPKNISLRPLERF